MGEESEKGEKEVVDRGNEERKNGGGKRKRREKERKERKRLWSERKKRERMVVGNGGGIQRAWKCEIVCRWQHISSNPDPRHWD